MNESTLTLLGNVSLGLAALWLVLQILTTVFGFVKSQKNGGSHGGHQQTGISNVDLQVVQELGQLNTNLSNSNILLQEYIKEDRSTKAALLSAAQAMDARTQVIDKNLSKAMKRQVTTDKLKRALKPRRKK